MATAVYDVVTVALQDGTEVDLRPLPIKRLRVFMKQLETLGQPVEVAEGEEAPDFVDQVVDLAKTCLEGNKQVSKVKDFEDVLDLPTTYKIIEVCTGIDLQDPKLMQLAQTMESDGQN